MYPSWHRLHKVPSLLRQIRKMTDLRNGRSPDVTTSPSQTLNTTLETSLHLKRYNLHGWRPSPSKTLDENYMDIVMLLTRGVNKKQGSMGCIIVNPKLHQTNKFDDTDFFGAIIGASTNQSLFKPMDSDIHAEIATLGECSKHGNSTDQCTIYITMPPCKRCFGALVSSGIRRIVSNRPCVKNIQEVARERKIELVTMSSDFCLDQKLRMNALIPRPGKRNNTDLNRETDSENTEKRKKGRNEN